MIEYSPALPTDRRATIVGKSISLVTTKADLCLSFPIVRFLALSLRGANCEEALRRLCVQESGPSRKPRTMCYSHRRQPTYRHKLLSPMLQVNGHGRSGYCGMGRVGVGPD
jgi:hypothetical protein